MGMYVVCMWDVFVWVCVCVCVCMCMWCVYVCVVCTLAKGSCLRYSLAFIIKSFPAGQCMEEGKCGVYHHSSIAHPQIERLLGSGRTLHKNTLLQRHVTSTFKRPLVLREDVDAPLGAAMAVSKLCVD